MRLVVILLILGLAYPKWLHLLGRESVNRRLLYFHLFLLCPIFLLICYVLICDLVCVRDHAPAIAHYAVLEGVLARHTEICQSALSCLYLAVKSIILVVHYRQIHIREHMLVALLQACTPLLLLFALMVLSLLGRGELPTVRARLAEGSRTKIHRTRTQCLCVAFLWALSSIFQFLCCPRRK